MMSIFSRIIEAIRPEKKTYVLKVTPEVLRQVPAYLKKELGMKESIILRQKEEIDKLKKEIEKLKGKRETEEERVVKELLKEKIKLERMKEMNRVRTFLPSKLPVVIKTWDKKFFIIEGKPLRFLKGWEYEETESGNVVNLLLTHKKDSKEFWRKKTGLPWEYLWENPLTFVSDIRSGMIRVRIDSKGKFHAPEEIKDLGGKETYKEILSMKKKYEDKVAELQETIGELRSELKKTKKREEKLLSKVMDLEMSNELNDFRGDINQSFTLATISKIRGMMKDYLSVLLSAQDSEVNRVLTERLNEILIDASAKMREKLGVEIPQELRDSIREKVRSEMVEALDFLHELSPRKLEVVRERLKSEEKGEKK